MAEDTDGTRGERVRLLLALEIHRIVNDLVDRQDFLITLWSRHRSRQPFRDTLFTRWRTVDFGHLAALDDDAIHRVQHFYDVLDRFRLYLEYTEDMPTSLSEQYDIFLERLATAADPALDVLGGVPERPDLGGAVPIPLDVPHDDES